MLGLFQEDWDKDWERIQYKNTPTRSGAVWFRREVGDCLIWDTDKDEVLCPGLTRKDDADEIIPNATMVHPALTLMEQDHPNVDRSTMRTTLAITDFRYRVEFSIDDVPIMEVSLDTLISEDLQTREIATEYEVELEIIADAPADENLQELFRVTQLMESQYQLTPSGRSKGGNYVPDSWDAERLGPELDLVVVLSIVLGLGVFLAVLVGVFCWPCKKTGKQRPFSSYG